ncbi:hypothetical protein Pmani_025045 [Petrolisthes manimaculis]|uniref:Uncharacterized protein n=1 Tax=Petrolisthes manimaculis TaxID=1843537 RepID=A0AAE1P7H4_9EUCA|nr:hypothetical protein Pmani_025045 [Petrolisthes manimaculis]
MRHDGHTHNRPPALNDTVSRSTQPHTLHPRHNSQPHTHFPPQRQPDHGTTLHSTPSYSHYPCTCLTD